MPPEITKEDKSVARTTATERLYLAKSDGKIVAESYTGERWLFCTPGKTLTGDAAAAYEAYQAAKAKKAKPAASDPGEPGTDAAATADSAPVEDKADAKSEDKARRRK